MKHFKLNQYYATAICGNDILSSTLYVSGIAIIFAGSYAPLVLLFIGLVLFFYKSVYTEVVEALPINGGVYNCLLNGTSKTIAAVGGVMTFLSYIATAVISANVGIKYLHTILTFIPESYGHTFDMGGTVVLLFIFALLVISGIKDSAKVALGIFSIHILTLITVVVVGFLSYYHGHSYFAQNLAYSHQLIAEHGGIAMALFLGFSASLLGISGFESSANFVEEQDKGVFRKTLRNMLIGVTLFNPLIALVALNTLPFEAIAAAKDFLLADIGFSLGGSILKYIVAIDAALVLSGAVLTSYVGVSGLMSRMTFDTCLPSFFGKMNLKGSFPRIIMTFFLLCSSILLLTNGNLLSLAGVYTIAFLGVMSLFAIGSLILKQTRAELKRTYRAPVIFVLLAALATLSGIFGNIKIDIQNLEFFGLYFIPTVTMVLFIVYQDQVIRALMRFTKMHSIFSGFHAFLERNFSDLAEGRFVVFLHNANRLHGILDYISHNETGCDITLVFCKNEDGTEDNEEFEKIKSVLPKLKEVGFFPNFTYHLEHVDMPFGPQAIEEISTKLDIRKNRIMIGSIHHFHKFDYEELGGVRIIF